MQWLQSAFGSDGSPIVQYVSIFAVIFVVLTVIVLVVRRLGGGGLADAKRAGQRGRQPRLGIVDVYELDRQRQLILLRRDNVEHLLLVGGPNDVVIERHIQRGQQRDPSLRPEPMAEPLPDAFPEVGNAASPAVAERRPEASFPPNFLMPAVLPPAVPGSGAVPPAGHPLDAGALDAAEPGPDRAAEVIVAGPRPEVPGRRPMRRTTPPLINPRPDVASERARTEPSPSESRDVAASMPPMAPEERRPIDPAILSDMARQLEAALARPASAVTLPPARPAPPAEMPATVPAPVKPTVIDPMAAAMAAPVNLPATHDERADETLFEASSPARQPAPFLPPPPPPEPVSADPPPSSPPMVFAPVETQESQLKPQAEPAAIPPKVETPRDPRAPIGPKPAANPFSVEEIEAEFARLLGRPLDKRN